MDVTRLSRRTICLTAAIWLAVFLVFFSTAVTLAVTSNPFYSFLIVVGLVASTTSANLYVSESRVQRTFAPRRIIDAHELGSVEVQVLPEDRRSPVMLRGALAKSEACLCTRDRPRGPTRSFSSSRIHETSFRVDLNTPGPSPAKPTPPGPSPAKPTPEEPDLEMEVAQVTLNDAQRADNQVAAAIFQQDIPRFWKESSSKDSSSRPGSSTAAVTTPWSSSSLYSKESKIKEDSVAGSHWEEEVGLLNSCGSFWSMDAVAFPCSSQGVYRMPEGEEVWETPVGSPKDSKLRVAADMSFGNGGMYQRSSEASGQDRVPSRAVEGHAVVESEAGRKGADDDRRPRKKSKKKFKLIPRFLKGKKKEFTRFI